MNAFNTIAVFATVAVAGVGPFIAVFRGARAFDPNYDDRETEPCTDDTIELPRVRARRDPNMY